MDYTYDKLNRISMVSNKKGSSVLSSTSYSYDDNGNVTTLIQTMLNQPTRTNNYIYDKLNRLTSVTRGDGTSVTYTYDLLGNRLTLADTGEATNSFDDISYQYDLNNTLVSAAKGTNTTTFDYAADGLRYKKTTGSKVIQYRYNTKQEVVAEVDGSNHTIANYVRGDRLLVKKDVASNNNYYYLYNGHGDVIQIVDTSGNVVNTYSYDEWGNIGNQTEGTPNVFKYAGEVYDDETGLYYLRARYYDPADGRFINEDTYEGQIVNPLSLNLYTYVTNNPLIYTDPTGHYNNHYDHGGSGGFLIRFRSNFKTSPEKLPEKIKTPSTPVRINLTQSEVDSLRAETNSLRARATSEGTGNVNRVISSVDDLSDASRANITTSQRATLNQQERTYSHLTEMDLKGAQRDLDGNPVPKPGGGYYDHAQEVSDAYRGLSDMKKSWEGILKNPNLDTELRQLYTSKLNEVNNTMKKVEDMFTPHGGVFPPK